MVEMRNSQTVFLFSDFLLQAEEPKEKPDRWIVWMNCFLYNIKADAIDNDVQPRQVGVSSISGDGDEGIPEAEGPLDDPRSNHL